MYIMMLFVSITLVAVSMVQIGKIALSELS